MNYCTLIYKAYSVVIVDEAHERSVNTDLVCGQISLLKVENFITLIFQIP